MTERWRHDLALLDTVEPDVEKLRALATSGPHRPLPSGPGPGRRAAIISLALAVAIGGFAFVFAALREEPGPTALDSPGEAGLVPSGGSYRLSNFQVDFPKEPRIGEGPAIALVTYEYEWTSTTFPGEAPCTIRLLDADGQLVTTLDSGLTAMMRQGLAAPLEIEVPSGIPASADGECGPGMVFDGRSQYVFSNLVVEEDRITGDIAWSAGTPVGDAACAARVVDPDGVAMIQVFTLGAGQGTDRTIVLLPGRFPDSGTAEVKCEPYRTEEQLQEAYWSPWSSSSVPTAEDFVSGEAPLGEPLAELLGLELQPGFTGDCSYYVGVGRDEGGYCIEGLSDDQLDMVAIGSALQGHRVTQGELDTARDTFASASPHA